MEEGGAGALPWQVIDMVGEVWLWGTQPGQPNTTRERGHNHNNNTATTCHGGCMRDVIFDLGFQ